MTSILTDLPGFHFAGEDGATEEGRRRLNAETIAAFKVLFSEWDETDEIAAEWLEVEGQRAPFKYARQLRSDFRHWYGGPNSDPLNAVFAQQGLRRVNWLGLAVKVVERPRAESSFSTDGRVELSAAGR